MLFQSSYLVIIARLIVAIIIVRGGNKGNKEDHKIFSL